MRLSTVFATMGGSEWTPPLPTLPPGDLKHLKAVIRQPDGSTSVFATLQIEGCQLSPERRSSLLRTFQIMAAGVAEANNGNVVILDGQGEPKVISP